MHCFSFLDYAFIVISKQPLPNVRPGRFVPLFSSKNCIVISFAYSVLLFPFELNFEAFLFFVCVAVKNNLWLGLLKYIILTYIITKVL